MRFRRGTGMDCGADVLCQAANWLAENKAWLVSRYPNLAPLVVAAWSWLADHVHVVFGLVGSAFGAWNWWHYRDKILHQRFESYLRASDRRLQDTRASVIERIQRPAPGRPADEPLFLDEDIRTVLREQNWDIGPNFWNVLANADWLLERAIKRIELRLSTETRTIEALNSQLASAYGIRGAIAVTRDDGSEDTGALALGYFRSAAKLAGKDGELDLKELEAHQFRKIGSRNAKHAYKELIALIAGYPESRERDYRMARAKWYLAEVVQTTSTRNAYKIMTTQAAASEYYPGALMLIYRCDPHSDWERVEAGDMHYFTAFCANQLNYKAVVTEQLDEATTAYEGVRASVSLWAWLIGTHARRLHQRAKSGRDRVARARQGKFEADWLPPQRVQSSRNTTPPA